MLLFLRHYLTLMRTLNTDVDISGIDVALRMGRDVGAMNVIDGIDYKHTEINHKERSWVAEGKGIDEDALSSSVGSKRPDLSTKVCLSPDRT